MAKLQYIIEPFVSVKETCEEVEGYFENGANKPGGPYYPLMLFFQGKEAEASLTDKKYKAWLDNLIKNENESESIVLGALKGVYNDKLEDFVFLKNDDNPKLNQKWHFFIAYWGLREFVTRYPEFNTDGISPLTDEFEANNTNPFRCTELKLWCNSNKEKG